MDVRAAATRISAIVLAAMIIAEGRAQVLPTLPQITVDTTYPTMSGRTISVASGGSFQNALDSAQPGDTITLQAGATFTGNFTLPAKSGTGWIIIRTSAPDSSLPPQGTRITPSYSSVLPKIVSANSNPAIRVAAAAHHYRLVGLEVTVASGVSLNYGLVELGDGWTSSLSQMPSHLVVDRCYIHGLTSGNVRRGIALNSGTAAVIDSYISECHEAGADSQAIGGWNGPGPYKIANNFLSGAGENVMFGGADPKIQNLVPSDIEIRGNHFYKPPAWRSSSWTVKNLFELKNAQRVLVEGNILEYNWPAAQNGYSILFTVRNQDGTAPWSTVQDVTFRYNIVRHVSSGINMHGTDNLQPSQTSRRFLIAHNLFVDVSAANWGGYGNLMQAGNGTVDVTLDHNTAFQTGSILIGFDAANQNFVYRNNLTPHNQYGVAGDSYYGNPSGALTRYFPSAVFTRNILQGGNSSNYPSGNFFPATMNDVGFVDYAGGNYRLSASSPYKNAGTDGRDVGADIGAVEAATAGVINGVSGTTPPPPPPGDTTPPTVAISSPSGGVTLSGTATISATASDNVGVVGVQFRLDGVALGSEDTSAPYTISWNTFTATNGSHTLTAVARDAAGNQTTSSGVSITVFNAVGSQLPYLGTAFAIPGEFQAEDFDLGGEGAAYHDVTIGNQGGLYRLAEDVDIISPSSGGYVVNNFQIGEWLEYTINVTATGTYKIEALVSSGMTGRFHIDVDGVNVTGAVDVPNTGSWTTFQWFGKDGVTLSAGTRILRITADVEYFNIDALRISTSSTTTPPPPPPPSQAPYTGVPFAVPGEFQAEDFDIGGEGVAYHDLTATNDGGLYRTTEGVDIISPSAGTYAVNNFQTSEWLEYTINVASSGTYKIEALVSSMLTGTYHIKIDGTDVTGPVEVPDTGWWGTFQWIGRDGVSLSAGTKVLRITADREYFNLDALRITTSTTTPPPPPPATQAPYYGTPFAVPGQFQAEDFDLGGEGVAYHDLVAGNQGALYRTSEDVDIISPYSGGYAVNNFQTGEWLEYTIQVGQTGTYRVEALVSSQYTTSRFRVSIDGTDVANVGVPNTGSWWTFQWIGSGGVALTAGTRVLRLTADAEYFNVDALRLSVEADTTAPVVAVTAPAAGSTVGGTVQLAATASDNVAVVGVRFLLDGVQVGSEDTSAPFTASWNTTTASNGAHSVTAIARDGAGNTATSAAVNVTVSNATADTTAPVVAVTSPLAGTVVTGTVQLAASASDNVGVTGVRFYVDGVQIGVEDTIAPYTASWDTTTSPNEWRSLSAVARDAAGNSTQSAAITVAVNNITTVDTTPPTVSITSPAGGSTVSGSVEVTAAASDNAGVASVQFYLNGLPLGVEDSSAPFSVVLDTTAVADGMHVLKAVARDVAGNTAESAVVSVTVQNRPVDTTPPSVSIVAPAAGATVNGVITLKASASDDTGVTGVHFYVDGFALASELQSSPYELSWDTKTISNGSHALTAVARDAAGNTATSVTVTVTVSNEPAVPPPGPYHGVAIQVPARFEAEDFDGGGEGFGYHDLTKGNQGGFYRREEDVDIVNPSGYVVNNFQTGEWLAYTIEAAQAGTYRIELLVSSAVGDSRFHLEVDGIDVSGSLNVPNTKYWTSFRWVGKSGIALTAGRHVLKVYADREYFNFDEVSVVLEQAADTTSRRRAAR